MPFSESLWHKGGFHAQIIYNDPTHKIISESSPRTGLDHPAPGCHTGPLWSQLGSPQPLPTSSAEHPARPGRRQCGHTHHLRHPHHHHPHAGRCLHLQEAKVGPEQRAVSTDCATLTFHYLIKSKLL